jgi:hypothetical protein
MSALGTSKRASVVFSSKMSYPAATQASKQISVIPATAQFMKPVNLEPNKTSSTTG